MTNQVVAGVGNIYANESLFQAGISPLRPVSKISRQGWQHLISLHPPDPDPGHRLRRLDDQRFRQCQQGKRGYFQINFQVYGRKGEGCTRCTGQISKIQIGGRASYYCPKCQK